MERRYIKTELRASSDGGNRTVSGYAAVFNSQSEELQDERVGAFREIILPGAFATTALSSDVTCNLDHNDERLLGRTSSGTLRIKQDDIGLAFDCDLPDTTDGRNAAELIRRGDLFGASFAFDVESDEWSQLEDGTPLRRISSISALYDTSIVVNAAYSAANISLRSLDKWRAIQTPPPCVSIEDDLDIRRRILALQEKL